LSRVINPDSAGKERTRLCKSVVLALRELMHQSEPNETSRDLAAFMALALQEVFQTVESSVIAWEKKGYWVKADRFRMEWEWTDRTGKQIGRAVLAEDWGAVALTSAQIAQKLMKVEVPVRNRLGTPWVGAMQVLKKG
jgi:hypothetical protein